jgi:heme oxygenase
LVDAAFGRFDLGEAAGYRAFLTAHARALPAAEARMAALPFAATLAPRAPLLAGDLAALEASMPEASSLPPADEAAAWGTLYVVEGSRLGGAMLARGVPAGWPAAYLGAVHPAGGWRAIRAAVDAAGADKNDAWRARMVAGALETFDLYARAAR